MASKQVEAANQRRHKLADRLVDIAAMGDPDQGRDLEVAIHLMRQVSVAAFNRAVAAYNKGHGLYQRREKDESEPFAQDRQGAII